MMKRVMWFEVTEPSGYRNSSSVIAGWQDSLEKIVVSENIELIIVFEDKTGTLKTKKCGNVSYVPISTHLSLIDRITSRFSWEPLKKKILQIAPVIVNQYNPDVIQVFGTEWPFGLIAASTGVPVVVHIQGSMVPYNNAYYPPNYSLCSQLLYLAPNVKKMLKVLCDYYKTKSREKIEKQVWRTVKYYMGRTAWDSALAHVMHKDCCYYHVDEALRPCFFVEAKCWKPSKTMKLISTGCSSFWKGPEMMLKTAKILKEMGFDFEWIVAGNMPAHLKKFVERKEKTTFEQNNIRLVGFMNASSLIEKLTESTCYVHTAYIENSPNSICEAQVLGVPVVSTNVGGISTLLEDYDNSIMVPANDPWQMAYAIVHFYGNSTKMRISNEGALLRHSPENIKLQLLNAYDRIVEEGR